MTTFTPTTRSFLLYRSTKNWIANIEAEIEKFEALVEVASLWNDLGVKMPTEKWSTQLGWYKESLALRLEELSLIDPAYISPHSSENQKELDDEYSDFF